MFQQDSDLSSKVQRLQLLLAVTFGFALLPWLGLGYVTWKSHHSDLTVNGVIVASSIDLRSASGATLVRLSAEGIGGDIQLSSSAGKPIVKIDAAAHGGDVALLTPEGGKLVHLGAGTGQGGSLQLATPAGKQSAYIGIDGSGNGNLTLNSKEGDVLVSMCNNMGHGGSLGLYDGSAHPRAFLGPDANESGGLQLWDKKDDVYATMGTSKTANGFFWIGSKKGGSAQLSIHDDGSPRLDLSSPGNDGAVAISSTKQGGQWKLFDARGQMRAFAGWLDDGLEGMKVLGPDGNEVCILCDTENGGFLQTYARNGAITLAAGCNNREGSGKLSLFHPSGQEIFKAGMAVDQSGGIINVLDREGKTILSAP